MKKNDKIDLTDHTGQLVSEDELRTGELDPNNVPYAIAKISSLKMCDYT